jgi:hypothetical protein
MRMYEFDAKIVEDNLDRTKRIELQQWYIAPEQASDPRLRYFLVAVKKRHGISPSLQHVSKGDRKYLTAARDKGVCCHNYVTLPLFRTFRTQRGACRSPASTKGHSPRKTRPPNRRARVMRHERDARIRASTALRSTRAP